MPHIRMCHVANTNVSFRKFGSYTRIHPLGYPPPSFRILVMPHTRSHAAYTNISRRKYECFMSRIRMSHAVHIPLKEEMRIKRATNYTALLRKMTYTDKACCTHSTEGRDADQNIYDCRNFQRDLVPITNLLNALDVQNLGQSWLLIQSFRVWTGKRHVADMNEWCCTRKFFETSCTRTYQMWNTEIEIWLRHVCDLNQSYLNTSHSNVSHASFHICRGIHAFVLRHSFICVTWLAHITSKLSLFVLMSCP